jgi:hypothetical protein
MGRKLLPRGRRGGGGSCATRGGYMQGIGRSYYATPPSGSRRAIDGREGTRVRRPSASRRRNRLLNQPRPTTAICSSVDSRAFADPLSPPVCEPTKQSTMDSRTRRGFGNLGSEPQCAGEAGSAPPRRHTGWGQPPVCRFSRLGSAAGALLPLLPHMCAPHSPLPRASCRMVSEYDGHGVVEPEGLRQSFVQLVHLADGVIGQSRD